MNLVSRAFRFLVKIAALIAVLVPIVWATGVTQTDPPQDTVKMLVLGDSVVWGQGLDDEEKFSHMIKNDVQELLGRPVEMENFSHSGATIEPRYAALLREHGEVPIPSPTIRKQFEEAIAKYKCVATGTNNRLVCKDVDLVLLNGCINDVALEYILNPTVTVKKIKKRSKMSCYNAMTSLLTDVSATFPNATIVVPGYFPIIREGSTPPSLVSNLLKAFLKKQKIPDPPKQFRLDANKWIVGQLAKLSEAWATSSNADLDKSVAEVNRKSGRVQIHFVPVHFAPDETYGAGNTHFWKIDGFDQKRRPITDDRKLEERRREHCCPAKTHLDQVKMESWFRFLLKNICEPAAAGHPNERGAQKYRDAIWDVLRPILSSRNKP